MSLSDKMANGRCIKLHEKAIRVIDVKQFIKELKENLKSQGLPSNGLFKKVKYERFVMDKIDRLAGEGLI